MAGGDDVNVEKSAKKNVGKCHRETPGVSR